MVLVMVTVMIMLIVLVLVIAEEVNEVLPNLVQKDADGNAYGIHYTNLIAYLVESIKELKQEIDTLKSK